MKLPCGPDRHREKLLRFEAFTPEAKAAYPKAPKFIEKHGPGCGRAGKRVSVDELFDLPDPGLAERQRIRKAIAGPLRSLVEGFPFLNGNAAIRAIDRATRAPRKRK